MIEGIHNIGVRGPDFAALFSRTHPGLVSYRLGPTLDNSRELLRAIPKPNFWHAPTANERGWDMPHRDGQWLLASRYAIAPDPPTLAVLPDSAEITYQYLLPTTPPSACEVAYRVHAMGLVEVTMTVTPAETLPDMPECGMIFICDADLRHLEWYGEGPEECYADRRRGARLGLHRAEVAQQLTPYLRPQESGNHTQVRWASVTDDSGQGLRFAAPTPMEFSALPWTPFEIENAAHAHELPPIHHTVIRPALARRGVGGDNSWGAKTHPEFCLPTSPLTFRFSFQGVREAGPMG